MAPTDGPVPPPPAEGSEASGRFLSTEEHAEYERLRRNAGVRHRRLRWSGAGVLLVLALLLAPLSVVAAWVDDQVSDTGRYVQTVAPLASDPAVQDVVTDRLTARVVAQVDVEAVTEALTRTLADAGAPPRVVEASESLAGPLRSAVRDVVDRTISRVVTSDVFAQAWEGANTRAHAAVVSMLTGEREGALRAEGDTVQLDLGQVVDEVQQRLVDAGFDKAAAIPDTDRTITLFQAEELGKAKDAMRLLDTMGTWLPVLTVALAALAVWTAPRHRRMLLVTAVGVGVMMIVFLVALALLRRVYLDAVPSATLPPDAAAAIYDTFVRFLRDSTRTLLVVAVITALAAYLYGPGRGARAVRHLARRGTSAAGRSLSRAGLRTGSAGFALAEHRSWTTGIVIGAGVLALVLWNHPTAGAVALVAGLVVVVLIVLETLAAAAQGPDTTRTGPAAAP
ncbi:hypothetical protein RFN58_36055 [Streptomyces iakyrus]|uniref:hypothetical protein n=1 Tax=Streptomyces iakyrus TaxID=68219 RepID=UPI0005263CD8|nr:hypothetical protein [Streptomyces iakyrus]